MKGALLIAVMLATTVLVESQFGDALDPIRNSIVTGPRSDLRCGSHYHNAICDPHGKSPCCSNGYWCGNTAYHCHCSGCVDYTGCHFPFKYNGNTYHSCTYDSHDHLWCALTADYQSGKWKNCNKKRIEDEKKEVLQDAAAVLKEVVHEAKKEAAMDLLERIAYCFGCASLDGSVAVPQDPAAEWEKKQEEAEEDAEEKLEEELEEELEELEEELKNKEGDE